MSKRIIKHKENFFIVFSAFIIIISVSSLIFAIISNEQAAENDVDIIKSDKAILVSAESSEKPSQAKPPKVTAVPTATPVPEIPAVIQEYAVINEDTVGYIKIDDTVIDYPVVYSGDNEYYLHYDFNKGYSYYGAIFLDFRCDVYDMEKTRNIILYGHRMKDGSMFKGLTNYFEKDFFEAHTIINFDTLSGEKDWEVFSVFETHIEFDYINTEFESDADWLKFIEYCQSLSLYDTEVKLNEDDIVLTLSTCSIYHDYRVVVMAKLLQ